MGVVEGTVHGKNRETLFSVLCSLFRVQGRGRVLAPPLIKSGKYDNSYAFSSEHCSRNRFNAVTKLSQMNAASKNN